MKTIEARYQLWLKAAVLGLFLCNLLILQSQPSSGQSLNTSVLPYINQADAFQETMESQKVNLLEENNDIPVIDKSAIIQSQRPLITSTFKIAPYCAYQPDVTYCLTTVTAYSSSRDQTDMSPFITASGKKVRKGIVACNFLDFGTKVKFPDLYGNRVFVVEDRMAPKNSHKIDIWFPSRSQALMFGVKRLKVEIIND